MVVEISINAQRIVLATICFQFNAIIYVVDLLYNNTIIPFDFDLEYSDLRKTSACSTPVA